MLQMHQGLPAKFQAIPNISGADADHICHIWQKGQWQDNHQTAGSFQVTTPLSPWKSLDAPWQSSGKLQWTAVPAFPVITSGQAEPAST